MSIKINDSTLNRPEGHRLIDAPAVQVNFAEYVQQLKTEKAWQTSDRNAITVFKTHGVTAVITALHKGAAISELQADVLLILQVMDGAVSITTDETQAILSGKQMLVLKTAPSGDIVAIEEAIIQFSYIKTSIVPGESVI